MKQRHLTGALLLAAASLLAMGAHAQNKDTAPQGKPSAADKAEKAADKAGDKAEKAADKAEKAADKAGDKIEKAGDKANAAVDRAARKAKEHDAQREKLKVTLKAPMDEATKQELRRHAERVAKLERIRTLAQTEKDTATVDKSTALITKENERHDRWMSKHTTPILGGGAAAPAAQPATTGTQGGAK